MGQRAVRWQAQRAHSSCKRRSSTSIDPPTMCRSTSATHGQHPSPSGVSCVDRIGPCGALQQAARLQAEQHAMHRLLGHERPAGELRGRETGARPEQREAKYCLSKASAGAAPRPWRRARRPPPVPQVGDRPVESIRRGSSVAYRHRILTPSLGSTRINPDRVTGPRRKSWQW